MGLFQPLGQQDGLELPCRPLHPVRSLGGIRTARRDLHQSQLRRKGTESPSRRGVCHYRTSSSAANPPAALMASRMATISWELASKACSPEMSSSTFAPSLSRMLRVGSEFA